MVERAADGVKDKRHRLVIASRGAELLEWSSPPDPASTPVAEAAAPFVPVLFELLDRARPHSTLFAVQRVWRRATARVLGGWVESGDWALADAIRVAELIGAHNARRVYRLS